MYSICIAIEQQSRSKVAATEWMSGAALPLRMRHAAVLRQTRSVCSHTTPLNDEDDDDEDAHTYASVIFRRPGDAAGDGARFVELEALVDTGSTDCELRENFVRLLSLPLEEEEEYETATGTQVEKTYRVIVEVRSEPRLVDAVRTRTAVHSTPPL